MTGSTAAPAAELKSNGAENPTLKALREKLRDLHALNADLRRLLELGNGPALLSFHDGDFTIQAEQGLVDELVRVETERLRAKIAEAQDAVFERCSEIADAALRP